MTLIFDIFKVIDEYEQKCMFDTEANQVYYGIEYLLDEGVIKVNEIDEYYEPMDDNHFRVITNTNLIEEWSGSTVGYANLCVDYVKCKQELELRFGEKLYGRIAFSNIEL